MDRSRSTDDRIWSVAQWEAFLEGRFDFPIRVIYGRSRSAPVQARALRASRRHGAARVIEGWELRLHHRFQSAPHEVRDALATWLRAGRRATKAGPVLDAWIHSEIASLPPRERRISLDDGGEAHDLRAIAEPLFETEFENDFEPANDVTRPRISWGRRALSRSRRSLRLGSFEPTSRIVRVHPVLDQEGVPEWFVRFVLKHEILHAVIETYRDRTGRWVHHGPEFRRREASWPEYEAALHWESKNLARLIRSAREGTKLRVRPEDLIDPDPQASSGPVELPAESPAEPPAADSPQASPDAFERARQPDLPFS
ncbi:hypothetical protein Poly30_19270 [Planctomycetes bacterium Poly30]|uniref:SprT-like family protein n=1 Tax=Saltatorellus ferox TaxID=2528018 RepID=A0A518EQQ1_9BACT|nr:hypothetical protein Poly30_19270 [Planctomycetes bacterium Poly30]